MFSVCSRLRSLVIFFNEYTTNGCLPPLAIFLWPIRDIYEPHSHNYDLFSFNLCRFSGEQRGVCATRTLTAPSICAINLRVIKMPSNYCNPNTNKSKYLMLNAAKIAFGLLFVCQNQTSCVMRCTLCGTDCAKFSNKNKSYRRKRKCLPSRSAKGGSN